ncbi:hypothetical protein LGL08_19580 [Clostridium estertheticum]|uniref:hypothetical protein n=1 Tax=Clostridium estertheticum TaxID=238834 RepID=UPI001CF4CEDE|nr:hypothetical protein [Clostridium estertheticum]MCB2308716.1 hypothetical protein [Clostridium estertheticum]MCB2347445.1 hypothetical protein [Clostridium estertheticum]MCB2351730.1 hypothetical protein [Clostridium estertheticum]WAG46309.1 hypothetical protein LL127_01720 [Clostridium estertheticum]
MEKEIIKEPNVSSNKISDEKSNVIDELKETCEKLLNENKLLIETMFNIGNKDGLTYWLEFKNDDEFRTSTSRYGGIAEGSSFKFIMYKRNSDGKWVTGNPKNHTILTTEGAINLGRDLRDSLTAGADLIDKVSEDASVQEYAKLQEQLNNILINNMSNLDGFISIITCYIKIKLMLSILLGGRNTH